MTASSSHGKSWSNGNGSGYNFTKKKGPFGWGDGWDCGVCGCKHNYDYRHECRACYAPNGAQAMPFKVTAVQPKPWPRRRDSRSWSKPRGTNSPDAVPTTEQVDTPASTSTEEEEPNEMDKVSAYIERLVGIACAEELLSLRKARLASLVEDRRRAKPTFIQLREVEQKIATKTAQAQRKMQAIASKREQVAKLQEGIEQAQTAQLVFEQEVTDLQARKAEVGKLVNVPTIPSQQTVFLSVVEEFVAAIEADSQACTWHAATQESVKTMREWLGKQKDPPTTAASSAAPCATADSDMPDAEGRPKHKQHPGVDALIEAAGISADQLSEPVRKKLRGTEAEELRPPEK